MTKVVFFGDSNSYIASILFCELVKYHNKSIEIVGVVDTNPDAKQSSIVRNITISMVKKLFNPTIEYELNRYTTFLKNIKNIKLYKPTSINDNEFINEIKKLDAEYAFSFSVSQIIKKELRNIFKRIINYHNSTLPKYRGLNATGWSLYFHEEKTGYTFHDIDNKIDHGNIFIQGEIDVNPQKSIFYHDIAKTKQAANQIENLILLLESGYKGKKQMGDSSYFSKKKVMNLLTFKKIDNVNKINKLIQRWGRIGFIYNGKLLSVTKINNDGSINRIMFLPPKLFFLLKNYIPNYLPY